MKTRLKQLKSRQSLTRKASTRFERFMCWLQTGHIWDQTLSHRQASRTMNRCLRCNHVIAGPD